MAEVGLGLQWEACLPGLACLLGLAWPSWPAGLWPMLSSKVDRGFCWTSLQWPKLAGQGWWEASVCWPRLVCGHCRKGAVHCRSRAGGGTTSGRASFLNLRGSKKRKCETSSSSPSSSFFLLRSFFFFCYSGCLIWLCCDGKIHTWMEGSTPSS